MSDDSNVCEKIENILEEGEDVGVSDGGRLESVDLLNGDVGVTDEGSAGIDVLRWSSWVSSIICGSSAGGNACWKKSWNISSTI